MFVVPRRNAGKTPQKKIQSLVLLKGYRKIRERPVCFGRGKLRMGTFGEQCSSRDLRSGMDKKTR